MNCRLINCIVLLATMLAPFSSMAIPVTSQKANFFQMMTPAAPGMFQGPPSNFIASYTLTPDPEEQTTRYDPALSYKVNSGDFPANVVDFGSVCFTYAQQQLTWYLTGAALYAYLQTTLGSTPPTNIYEIGVSDIAGSGVASTLNVTKIDGQDAYETEQNKGSVQLVEFPIDC